MFLAAPKMVSFSQLPTFKKDTIFGASRKFFGSSYFVTALVCLADMLESKRTQLDQKSEYIFFLKNLHSVC